MDDEADAEAEMKAYLRACAIMGEAIERLDGILGADAMGRCHSAAIMLRAIFSIYQRNGMTVEQIETAIAHGTRVLSSGQQQHGRFKIVMDS